MKKSSWSVVTAGVAGGFDLIRSWPPYGLNRLIDSRSPLLAVLLLGREAGLCLREGVGTTKWIVYGRNLSTWPELAARNLLAPTHTECGTNWGKSLTHRDTTKTVMAQE